MKVVTQGLTFAKAMYTDGKTDTSGSSNDATKGSSNESIKSIEANDPNFRPLTEAEVNLIKASGEYALCAMSISTDYMDAGLAQVAIESEVYDEPQ